VSKHVSWRHINKLKTGLETIHPGDVTFYQNGGELDFGKGLYRKIWVLKVKNTTLEFDAIEPKK